MRHNTNLRWSPRTLCLPLYLTTTLRRLFLVFLIFDFAFYFDRTPRDQLSPDQEDQESKDLLDLLYSIADAQARKGAWCANGCDVYVSCADKQV